MTRSIFRAFSSPAALAVLPWVSTARSTQASSGSALASPVPSTRRVRTAGLGEERGSGVTLGWAKAVKLASRAIAIIHRERVMATSGYGTPAVGQAFQVQEEGRSGIHRHSQSNPPRQPGSR
jgi:hypothetical protein